MVDFLKSFIIPREQLDSQSRLRNDIILAAVETTIVAVFIPVTLPQELIYDTKLIYSNKGELIGIINKSGKIVFDSSSAGWDKLKSTWDEYNKIPTIRQKFSRVFEGINEFGSAIKSKIIHHGGSNYEIMESDQKFVPNNTSVYGEKIFQTQEELRKEYEEEQKKRQQQTDYSPASEVYTTLDDNIAEEPEDANKYPAELIVENARSISKSNRAIIVVLMIVFVILIILLISGLNVYNFGLTGISITSILFIGLYGVIAALIYRKIKQ